MWEKLAGVLRVDQESARARQILEQEERARFLELTTDVANEQTPMDNQAIQPPIPQEELLRFLELGIDARTDDYLRQLARIAAQAASVVETSAKLSARVDRLEQREQLLAAQLKQQSQQFTEQSRDVAKTLQRLNDQIERRERMRQLLKSQNLHGQPPAVVERFRREIAEALSLSVVFHHPLKDGGKGPEMLIIPPGHFLMGAPNDEQDRQHDEGPQHPVTLASAFAIGSCAVTFNEYDAFCRQSGQEKPHDQGWGRGWMPAINVTWNAAQTYCVWLTEQTGFVYRLPSEAEWEYAARAGSASAFWWGNGIDTRWASYAGEKRTCTVPVKQFASNSFGLYQVHGNVREWCQDRWHGSYAGAPPDGSAWETNAETEDRVLRGGSWRDSPMRCRAASRFRAPDRRYDCYYGFRVCCDILID
ncbi:SUMF1/EgtB/PvdO family nonheme iron enzyme [uncultured Thiocystis sp.]|jgi:formylglycine-generating enzyme required for sulfatase activity|uniref:formylglycine-generating enzyme family protein n=1 Tax=uncultured Thiocystis sp. TaxID=1202134 RepID=UPI0025E460EA|nr:SUMF1/EgtB/PvdO family nonheme iron enzyme [uncultured Thiocystis sp.]